MFGTSSIALAAPSRRLAALLVTPSRLAASPVASTSRVRLFSSSVCCPNEVSGSSSAGNAAAVSASEAALSRPIPPPRPNLGTPAEFLKSISTPRRDLASNSSAATALGEQWASIFSVKTQDLKKAGLSTKDRRYILWAIEKIRQGRQPEEFVYEVKTKKKVRGWGPRVQRVGTDLIRVRGRKRQGEK